MIPTSWIECDVIARPDDGFWVVRVAGQDYYVWYQYIMRVGRNYYVDNSDRITVDARTTDYD